MGLPNIDCQKVSAVLVILIHLGEVAHLAPEWRSSIAAENEDKRAPADAVVQVEICLAVERNQASVRRVITNTEIALMPLRKSVTKEAVHIARRTHEIAEDAIARQQEQGDHKGGPFQPAHDTSLREAMSGRRLYNIWRSTYCKIPPCWK